jgi:hypothetical protein
MQFIVASEYSQANLCGYVSYWNSLCILQQIRHWNLYRCPVVNFIYGVGYVVMTTFQREMEP